MVNRTLMRMYAAVLVVLTVLAAALILPRITFGEPTALMALIGLTAVLGNLAVELPFAVSMSLMFSAFCAGVFYIGPWGGFLLGLAGSISIQEIRDRKPPVLLLVNAAQLSLSGLLSGWVFVTLGTPIMHLAQSSLSWPSAVVAPVAAVTTSYAVNLLLVGLALHIKTGMAPHDVLDALSPTAYLLSMLILALLGYVIAHLIALQSWLGMLLLILPFAMARRTFRVYVELTEAYASTVRSLVAAIEAKDPYTRGHSERVAKYAQAIAGHMGLPQSDVQVLERAALLHDVGKIGISLDTLVSPDELSEDEMRAIRRHPGLGADLVTDVDFLHDIVDVVRCHHERCDGGGYPNGILGDDIPLLARILAAADSFDAMTSDRAYRPGIPFDKAIDELRRVAGQQLDERVVASFVEVLRSDELAAMAS